MPNIPTSDSLSSFPAGLPGVFQGFHFLLIFRNSVLLLDPECLPGIPLVLCVPAWSRPHPGTSTGSSDRSLQLGPDASQALQSVTGLCSLHSLLWSCFIPAGANPQITSSEWVREGPIFLIFECLQNLIICHHGTVIEFLAVLFKWASTIQRLQETHGLDNNQNNFQKEKVKS